MGLICSRHRRLAVRLSSPDEPGLVETVEDDERNEGRKNVNESTHGEASHETEEPQGEEYDRKDHQHGEGSLWLFLCSGESEDIRVIAAWAHRTRADKSFP